MARNASLQPTFPANVDNGATFWHWAFSSGCVPPPICRKFLIWRMTRSPARCSTTLVFVSVKLSLCNWQLSPGFLFLWLFPSVRGNPLCSVTMYPLPNPPFFPFTVVFFFPPENCFSTHTSWCESLPWLGWCPQFYWQHLNWFCAPTLHPSLSSACFSLTLHACLFTETTITVS